MTRLCAPIALFVYNRPAHTRLTVEALRSNLLAGESDLIIFSDAPKKLEVAASVAEVRDYIYAIDGFKSVRIVERQTNFGLARSIVEGVGQVCEAQGRVIALEDDLETSPYFLTFMNDGLDRYAEVPEVAAVSGFHLPVDIALPETFFQCDAECWGWATWRRAWALYNPDGRALLSELTQRNMQRMFDQEGAYPYVRMLEDQIAGKNSSWAVRWRASVILKGMLSLYPGRTLVRNIGFDGSGTHCVVSDVWNREVSATPINVTDIPLVHSGEAYWAFVRFNRSQIPKFRDKVLGKLKSIARRFA